MIANTIDITGLRVHRSKHEAVAGLDLQVPKGRVLGLLGPNGAGKTTTMQTLAGILHASAGHGTVLGQPLGEMTSREYARLGYVSESQKMPLHWTVKRLCDYLRPLYPTWDEACCQQLLQAYSLPMDRPLKTFSRGQLMKAKLVAALAYRPDLLLLDEPFSGLDAVVREDFIDGLLHLMSEGDWTVVITSHELDEMERLCDDVCLLAQGRAVLTDSVSETLQRFRRWEVNLSASPPPPCQPLPSTWRQVRQDGQRWQFVQTDYQDDATSQQQFSQLLGPIETAHAQSMSLREIYVSLIRESSFNPESSSPLL